MMQTARRGAPANPRWDSSESPATQRCCAQASIACRTKLGEYKFRRAKGRSIFVDYVPASVAKVFTLDEAAICAGDAQILEDVHLASARAKRKIRVAGPNGIGKTTLLAAMLRAAHVALGAHSSICRRNSQRTTVSRCSMRSAI